MSIIPSIFRSLSNKSAPIAKKVTELTPQERSEIEDQSNAGMASREIADSLNLTVESVYQYRKILNQQRKDRPSDTTKDILASKMQEREILKADYELEKLRLDLEQKKQSMEMDRLTFAKDMQRYRQELGVNDQESELDKWLPIITSVLPAVLGNTSGKIHAKPPQNNNPPVEVAKIPEIQQQSTEEIKDPEMKDMTDDQIREVINTFDKKQIKIAKSFPNNIIFDKIADQFPTISDQSINRAIEILRSEY